MAEVVDTTVMVMAPGMGDSVQALKAGVLEVGDVFVVNKADHRGAGQTEAQLRGMLDAGTGRGPGHWRPTIHRTVAVRAEGIDELLDAVSDHLEWAKQGPELRRRRDLRLDQVLRGAVVRRLFYRLDHDATVHEQVRVLAEKVTTGGMPLTEAADRLLASLGEGQ